MTDPSLDNFLKEVRDVEKNSEMERINNAMVLDPIAILDVPYHATAAEIRQKYKKLCVFVHPDKVTPEKRELAVEVFDKLTKAYKNSCNEEKRRDINKVVQEAGQFLTARKRRDKKSNIVLTDRELKEEVRKILIDREWKNRQIKKLSKKFEKRQNEERNKMMEEAKTKREHSNKWEADRSKRISSWRSFNQKIKERSKRKYVKGVHGRIGDNLETDQDRLYIKRVKKRS